MKKNTDKYWPLLICLILTLVTLAVFYQVHSFSFINYDDQNYVYENLNIQSGLTLNAVKWAFTTGYYGNWNPLTWLSYMLDWQFFGSNAAGFHLTSLIFHIANTLLLFLVLKRMTSAIWQSAFVAVLFALHPLHVESVAWVSSRKDVLSTFFWLLTMAVYIRYVKQPNIFRYLLVLLIFVMGIMAKPMLVALPFVLLLLDYWPLDRIGRFQLRVFYRLILEKIPFIALAAVFSALAFFTQRSIGALAKSTELSLKFRIYNALISYVEYIEKMFWPSRLAAFYPHPAQNVSFFYAVMSAGFLLVVTVLILRFAKNHRYLITGWFWYLGTLVPVIGIIQVGDHAMADRYTYITLTGLFIIIAWGFPDLLAKWRYRKVALASSALLIILAMSICTCFQLRYWRNSLTLFQHAIDVTKNNYLAHYCIAGAQTSQGRVDEAIYHYSQAIRISPDYIDALNGLGVALHEAGRVDEAIGYYKRAIELSPSTPEAYSNLGIALTGKGRFAEAVRYFRIAVTIRDTPRTHSDLGSALLKLGMFQDAVTEYRKVLSAMPNDPNTLNDLGYALMNAREFDEAILLYNKALEFAPDSVNIHLNLGVALISSGKFEEAIKVYEKILFFRPQNAIAHNCLGVALSHQGKLDDAISHFKQAIQIDKEYLDAKNNLNAALAEKQKTKNKDEEINKK